MRSAMADRDHDLDAHAFHAALELVELLLPSGLITARSNSNSTSVEK
jgi:hypothetical protein